MPSTKSGLPRDWSRSEQLSEGSLRSGSNCNSVSARYINSVSDLYATDEIDALLEEIRDLEPGHNPHLTDELQDFEIDGSLARLPFDMTCDSRTSVHSWDSHALYHNNAMDESGPRQGGPISMYCDTSHLKSPIGILRIVLLVASAVSLGCLVYSGTAKYGLFMLPYVGRIRFMIFVILFNSLVTLLLLFLDISILYTAFPLFYHKWVIGVYIILCSGYCGASGLLVSLVHIYIHHYSWVSGVTRDQLIASSVFGFLAGFCALLMAAFATYELCRLHLPLREESDQLTLTERASREIARLQGGTSSKRASQLHSPPVLLEPPVTATIWPIDDVQPCSSKHVPSSNNTPTGGGLLHHHGNPGHVGTLR